MVANQTISVIFVEMTLFTKTLEECVTESDRLFYIFRNSGGFQKIPEWIEEAGGISRRLAEACEVAAFDKEKKLKYEIDKMNERDILAQRVFAERKGFEKGYADGEAKGIADGMAQGMAQGMAEGMAQGMAQGKAQGKAEGKAEGITEGKTEVAKAMLEIGMPDRADPSQVDRAYQRADRGFKVMFLTAIAKERRRPGFPVAFFCWID